MWLEFAQVIASACLGLFGVAVALNGYLFRPVAMPLRLVLVAAGLAMMIPGTLTDVVGLVVIAAIVVLQYLGRKRDADPDADREAGGALPA